MKTSVRIAVIALLGAAFALPVLGGERHDFTFDRTLAETNLLIGINSDNAGLRLSAASILADVGTDRAVNTLLQMLYGGNENERSVAACALSKIEVERGVWAVRRAAECDPSENVRRLAAWYDKEYAMPKPENKSVIEALTMFAPPEPYPEHLDGIDDWSSLSSCH